MKTSKITLLLLAATVPAFGQSYINLDWFKENKAVALGFAGMGTLIGVLFVKDSNKGKKIDFLKAKLNALEKQSSTNAKTQPASTATMQMKDWTEEISTLTNRVTKVETDCDQNTEDLSAVKAGIKRTENMLGIFSVLLKEANTKNTENWTYFANITLPSIYGLIQPKKQSEIFDKENTAEDNLQGILSSAYYVTEGASNNSLLNRGIRNQIDQELIMRKRKKNVTPALDHLDTFNPNKEEVSKDAID